MGFLLAAISHGLIEILAMARAHWIQPTLFGDSFDSFVSRGSGIPIAQWIIDQHNEHRLVFAKASSLWETTLLKLLPGQSNLFQNLALIVACAGLWSWLCIRLLRNRGLQLLTSLAGFLLLLNPWQYENLSWEFQSPWFFINVLVLAAAFLLSVPGLGIIGLVLALILPWIALASSGQGLAVSLAFAICAWLHSRKLGLMVSCSGLAAVMTFFIVLPYSKPNSHPEFTFNLLYFLRALSGGGWQGLGMLCFVVAIFLLARRRPIPRKYWSSLLMPGLFSLLFVSMITLSRAGFGLEQASVSRYTSHSMMLGLSALLAFAVVEDRNRLRPMSFLGAFLALIATVGSFPQNLQAEGLAYPEAWAKSRHWAEEKRSRFACHAEQYALKNKGINLLKPCKKIHPRQQIVDDYFEGRLSVQPTGWHGELLETPSHISVVSLNSEDIQYVLDKPVLSDKSIRLRGWAFLKPDPSSSLYLIIHYGNSSLLGQKINFAGEDISEAYVLRDQDLGFDIEAPLFSEGAKVHSVSIAGLGATVKVWSHADGK